MKIIYLLPPSEGKNSTPPNLPLSRGGTEEKLSFMFEKPKHISENATEKDLKCSGKRYEEGVEMNKNIDTSEKLQAISRYSGVMYSAINFDGMSQQGKKYFSENFLILSGMYGILRPSDEIGNYKLPIETKGLVNFWDTKITDTLNDLQAEIIVDLLPLSYKKMIQWKNLKAKVLRVEFYQNTPLLTGEGKGVRGVKNGERKKMTHGVKKVKGEWIYDVCENGGIKIPNFQGQKEYVGEIDA